MKIDGEMAKANDERAVATQKSTGSDGPKKEERYGQPYEIYIRKRVCPYCLKSIPIQEDPCHYCGRLEPAARVPKLSQQASNCMEVVFLIFVVGLGLAMIIWPKVNISNNWSCEPDTEISCFIVTSWGVPGGVFLIGLASLCVGLHFLTRYLRNRQ